MSDHTRLSRKPTNLSTTIDSTGFTPPTRGISSLASTPSLAPQSIAAPQTTPEAALSPQETEPQAQDTPDLQTELYGLPGHDFSKIALFQGAIGQIASSGEEPPRSNSTTPTLQRKISSHSPQPLQGHDFGRVAVTLQAKLTVSQPDDPYEQEADRIAEQVMQMPESEDAPAESVQEFSGHDFSQISILPQLQPAAEPVEVSRGLEQQLTQSQGGGNPLPDETRSFMESRFGADLSAVRVHTDTSAAQMNQALNAQAFTHGNDIYFGAGTSPGKNDLTAHELTHTIQQTGHSTAYQPEPFLDSPMSGDLEQFGSASHRWGAASSQIQKQPISVAQAFSIQRRAGSSTQAEDNQDTKQTRSDAITAPSPRDGHPPTPSISEGAASTTENPYKSQPTTENQPASQDDAQNIKQNHKIAPPTSTGSAANDPDFQAVAARGQEVAQVQQQHDPAELESKEAQDAAQAPGNEVTSKAQDRHVGEMTEQQPGEFDPQAFKAAIFDALKTAMPGNLEAAENFDQNNDLDSVRQKVSSDVGAERDRAAAPIEDKTQEPPDPSGIEPKPETPMQPPDRGVAPGAIGAERATPKPKSDAEVSQPLEANQQEIDQQMAEADITEEQLANANEPEFTAALDARREVKADAEQAPAAYRQQEQTTLSQAQAEAQTTAATQLEEMHNQRQDSMAQVEGLQGETKSADEQKRTEIADHINGIYERVKGEVETSLSTLETDVTTKFDTAADTARRVFEDYIKREKSKFLSDRYFGDPARQGREAGEQFGESLGLSEPVSELFGHAGAGLNVIITGGGRVINDTFTGLPPEVEGIFAKGREQYLADMSVALDEIATTVATRLNEAMQKIKGGREDIRKYVDSLSPDLRQIGQEAATSIESKFDDLEQQVRDKHDQLVDTLAQKYQERLKEIDGRIEEMTAENRGLFDRAMDAIGGVIQTINEIKAMLQGLLADAMTAIGMILKDPIGFLDNLLKALNQGFNQFLENIGEHLQSGLIGWLTGAIGAAGIQMPENIFSLEGIFSLAAQILGFGWEFIRDKAVGMFGESTVGEMEESVDIFQTLKNDGLKGLWQQIQSQFTDLKETVMDEVQSILTVEVIQAGVTWVLSLFSPASAFIRAAKMIVDVIIFFVENASQIMELVQAVVQSIAAIASGSIGAAANAIESALARAIPVLIGLLASLLGIGGLANKVQDVFERIRKRIDDAIEKLLKKVRQLFKGEKGKDNEEENDKDKNEENDAENASDVTPEKQRDVDDATPRQDADDMESDRDITSPSSNGRRKSNEQQSDGDTSVDAPDRQRPKDHNEDTETTPDAKRDRHDDQDADTPRRDKSDQPDQRRRDQDDPDQQRRRDRDQDGDSSPDRKRDRDGEDGDRKPEEDNRTMEEKKNDLEAAEAAVRRIIARSEDTEEVEKHFLDIKREFRLKKLEWKDLGTPAASIAIEINPRAYIDIDGKLAWSEDPAFESSEHKNDVEFQAGNINLPDNTSETVGICMEAKKLGPSHPLGSEPENTALSNVMGYLDSNYRKGHLLNADLGGPGQPQNLYPITASANSLHFSQVERTVKKWVNEEGYWVYYKVAVENQSVAANPNGTFSVSADLHCETSRLDAEGQPVSQGKISQKIHSEENKSDVQGSRGFGEISYSQNSPEKDANFNEGTRGQVATLPSGEKTVQEYSDELNALIGELNNLVEDGKLIPYLGSVRPRRGETNTKKPFQDLLGILEGIEAIIRNNLDGRDSMPLQEVKELLLKSSYASTLDGLQRRGII